MRHLPPSAVPVATADLRAGLKATSTANLDLRAATAAYFDLDQSACFLASSGRTVFYTLLKGLSAAEGARRQVIMPAYTCPVLPKVAHDLGLEPVYVDINLETTAYEPEQLAETVGERTLAVLLVHPFGIPLPPEPVLSLAKTAGGVVIEDAAQAMGARWNGLPVGLNGDFGLFSLGPGKPLSTAGGGIAIAAAEYRAVQLSHWWAELPAASSADSIQAWTRQALFRLAFHPRGWWAATRIGLQRLGNEETSWGYSVRGLSDAQAAVGLALLPKLDDINSRRESTAARLLSAVENSAALVPLKVAPEADAIYLRFPLLAVNEAQREQLFQRMWSAGIGAGRLYERTLPSIFEPRSTAAFPGAEAFARRLLTLPTHYHVTESDIEIMEAILADF